VARGVHTYLLCRSQFVLVVVFALMPASAPAQQLPESCAQNNGTWLEKYKEREYDLASHASELRNGYHGTCTNPASSKAENKPAHTSPLVRTRIALEH
jgi:hypothetical protein